VHAKQQEGQTVEGHLQRLLDRVEAGRIEPVELLDRVMNRMQAPERVILVREPVQVEGEGIWEQDEDPEAELGAVGTRRTKAA